MQPDPSTPQPASGATNVDVLVVGGGPAGSTAATLLRRRGWNVRMLERDRHPRFHIGESLLPMNMPLLEELGVMPDIERIGVRKLGADFPSSDPRGYNTFAFARSYSPNHGYAFQVKREEFDQVLFRRAAHEGVDTTEGCTVEQIEFASTGVIAHCRHDDGRGEIINARYLVDASGRDTLLGRLLRLKRKSATHQSAALFAHFRGVQRRPGEDHGNISIYRFAQGWVWVIPLRDGVTSIGAVCTPDHLRQRHGRGGQLLLDTLHGIEALRPRLADAELIGNLHATGNYSYACRRIAGPRWLMVGDAYAFVDPIFSSGVFLAMRSAAMAVEVVDGSLRAAQREAILQRRYHATLERGLRTFGWFIHRFNTPAMRVLLADPRNHWRIEEALISMLAGDVFGNRGVQLRLTLFKAIYYLTALGRWRASLHDHRERRRLPHAQFSGGSTGQDDA